MVNIRVLIADDHAVLRAGLALLINAQPDMQVAGEAEDGADAIDKVRKLRPDVVLLDLTMPRVGGFDALREIVRQFPETHVLALTMHDDSAYGRNVLAAGGYGFVTKKAADREVLSAIRAVNDGRQFVDISQAEGLLPLPHRRSSGRDVLSQREGEVLTLLAEGYTHKEIADKLSLSIKTVETYLTRVGQKLGLKRRADLVRYALEAGLLTRGTRTS